MVLEGDKSTLASVISSLKAAGIKPPTDSSQDKANLSISVERIYSSKELDQFEVFTVAARSIIADPTFDNRWNFGSKKHRNKRLKIWLR